MKCIECKYLIFEDEAQYYFCSNCKSVEYGNFLGLYIDNECEGGCPKGEMEDK